MPGLQQQVRVFPYEQAQLKELNTEGHTNLVDMFDAACAEFSERPAFTALGQTLTFAETDRLSRDFAAYLLGPAGLLPGQRIAIALPNLCQYPIVAWAALRAGLVLVNTNPLYTPRELLHQFNDAGVCALVCFSDLLPTLEQVVPQTDIAHVIVTNVFDLIEAQPAPKTMLTRVTTLPAALAEGARYFLPDPSSALNDIAILQYTGGTTGPAKGAVLTHGNILASSRQSGTLVEIDPEHPNIVIAPMPLYHIYGFTMSVVGTFCVGGHSILIPDPRDLNGMIEAMKAWPFTAMAGVNTLFVGLMRHPEFDAIDFSQVKGVIAGGAALVEEIATEWKRRTGSDIYEGYGLSETASSLTCNSEDNRQLGTVGKLLPWMEIKIVAPDGETLAVGAEGELLVRGPQVMHGYWQRPDATDEALDQDGWFRTGDIAVQQEDSFIRICDRVKDMILVSGFNVYPNEVESVVYTHPDIVECAAVGVPDEKSGEAVKLYVVSSNPDLDSETLRSFCRKQLAAYKVPRTVEFRTELPKSNVGKILRRKLR
jgi:long-chain acyl-CoA synthetase